MIGGPAIFLKRPYALKFVEPKAITGGCKVLLYYDSDTGRISSLSLDMPIMTRRLVEKFDAEKRLLTLATHEGKLETFHVPDDAYLMQGDATLAKLQAKRFVNVVLSLDDKEAIYVSVLD